MTDKSTILLSRVRDAIKFFVSNELNTADAQKVYHDLYTEYKALKTQLKNDTNPGYLKSLLTRHNIYNFSKVSCLYDYRNDNLTLLTCTGDEKKTSVLQELLLHNINDIPEREAKKIFINNDNGLDFFIYTYKFNSSGGSCILISLTSSTYFQVDIFHHLSLFLESLITGYDILRKPFCIDFSGSASKTVLQFIEGKLEKNPVTVNFFVFPELTEVFSHLGMAEIKKISTIIMETLKERLPWKIRIFQLSFKTYLVLYEDSTEDRIRAPQKFHFEYNGITIPFKNRESKILNISDSVKLFHDLNDFENTVITGGLMK